VQKLYSDIPNLSSLAHDERTRKLYSLCAVVDRLPEPQPFGTASLADEISQRATQPPVTETGHEGIAYVVLPRKAGAVINPVLNDQACIDFLAHTHTDVQGRHCDRIRVPLANTVFQTGEQSTMFSSKWNLDTLTGKLSMTRRKSLHSHTINLSAVRYNKPTPSSATEMIPLVQEAPRLSIPLLPLTIPRQVDGHMGNIIRSIVGPDGVKITAATELEQVVPQYFKSRNEPAQATSAWALVIPKDTAHLSTMDTVSLVSGMVATDSERLGSEAGLLQGFQSLWQQDPPSWNVTVQEALARGARLHKVLSGGGGWGKKAGLLSLDPTPLGPPQKSSKANGIQDKGSEEDDHNSVEDFSTALKPVVHDGDYIQFFISASPTQQSDDGKTLEHLHSTEEAAGNGAWTWEFGVVPSTVDTIPGGSWQHTGDPSTEIVAFRGTFGALAEGGLTLMRGLNVHNDTGYAQTDLNTTMVDVPFSRWSAVRLLPKHKLTTTVGDLQNRIGKEGPGNNGRMRQPYQHHSWDSDNAGNPP
jgi:hypothetical protein